MDAIEFVIKLGTGLVVIGGLIVLGRVISNRVDFSLIRDVTDEGTSKCINSMEETAISLVMNENVAGPTGPIHDTIIGMGWSLGVVGLFYTIVFLLGPAIVLPVGSTLGLVKGVSAIIVPTMGHVATAAAAGCFLTVALDSAPEIYDNLGDKKWFFRAVELIKIGMVFNPAYGKGVEMLGAIVKYLG